MPINNTIKTIVIGLLLACNLSSFSMEKVPTTPEVDEPLKITEHWPDVPFNPWNPRYELCSINRDSHEIDLTPEKPFEGRKRDIPALAHDIASRARRDGEFAAYILNPQNLLVLLKSYPKAGALNLFQKISAEFPDIKTSSKILSWYQSVVLENGQMLYKAVSAENPDLKVIETLLENPNVEVDWKESRYGANYGATPLIIASRDGRTEIAKLLLDAGANTNAMDGNGWTALGWAIRQKHFLTAKLLLSFDKEFSTSVLWYEMHKLKFSEDPQIKQFILEYQEELNQKLYNAVDTKTPDMAQINRLLRNLDLKHQGPNLKNKHCVTSLMGACANGHTEVVQRLLSYGADLFLKDNQGRTALDHAVENKQDAVVTLFKEKGCAIM